MIVYRITLLKFSKKLIASGVEARWNSKNTHVIYTANSKALACLENLVHRNAHGLKERFMVISISIPDSVKIEKVELKKMKRHWNHFDNQDYTRSIGDEWIKRNETAVLQVPSSIIADEFNYLLNPKHKDFKKIKIVATDAFEFDARLKK